MENKDSKRVIELKEKIALEVYYGFNLSCELSVLLENNVDDFEAIEKFFNIIYTKRMQIF